MPIHNDVAHLIVMLPRDFEQYRTPFPRIPANQQLNKQFHVFISYRVAANKEEAERLCTELQKRSVIIFKQTAKASEQHMYV